MSRFPRARRVGTQPPACGVTPSRIFSALAWGTRRRSSGSTIPGSTIAMADRVLANHAHVFPASINPHGTTDRLLRLMDACGIEQAVCFAPFCHQCQGTEVDEPNRWLASAIARQPRLLG